MESKKSPKPSKTNKDWRKKVEERIKLEKVELDHPKGKERFVDIIKQFDKKKKRS